MADEKKPAAPQDQPQTEQSPEPDMAANETIKGGKYMQGDQMVNAWGEPIDSKGNVKKGE